MIFFNEIPLKMIKNAFFKKMIKKLFSLARYLNFVVIFFAMQEKRPD